MPPRIGDPQILHYLRDRFLHEPGQLDRSSTEFRRVWTWHLDSLPETTTVTSELAAVNPGDL